MTVKLTIANKETERHLTIKTEKCEIEFPCHGPGTGNHLIVDFRPRKPFITVTPDSPARPSEGSS